MNFSDAIRNEQKWTRTENGAVALNTTGTALLDLFSTIGAFRGRSVVDIETAVEEAYKEDKLNTVKCLFYARDVREGLGERNTFRVALRYLASHHPEAVERNIYLIGEFGRWDDIYCLVGTPVEEIMWKVVSNQFGHDVDNMNNNLPISLLGKWLKSVDTSSEESRRLGRLTAEKLHLINDKKEDWRKYLPYRNLLKQLRNYIKVVEKKMCSNTWNEIKYEEVPSRASMIYRNAFKKHDEDRYNEYINQVNSGEKKINASTLYPYDLVEKYWNTRKYVWSAKTFSYEEDHTVEALWKALPNYVTPGTNAVVIADTSGSMQGRPMNSAIGLALYFAQRNTGAYNGLWMNFSSYPSWQRIKGTKLCQMMSSMDMDNWGGSTNLEAAFELVLDTAINNNVSPDEMPKSIIVISDMEIDNCTARDWTFYDQIKAKFASEGYEIPQIIFWNVDSRHDVFHADNRRKGVILCSGQSTTTFKTLINSIGMTPVEYMMSVLNGDRYQEVTISRN